MRRLFIVVLGVLAGTVGADVVRLKNGRSFEGKIIEETEREVKLRTGGGEVTLTREQIEAIERGESPLEQYERRAAALKADDADGHYTLGEFCLEEQLHAQAIAELRRVLAIQPVHKLALAKLRPLLDQRAAPFLARAKGLQAKGDYEEAEQALVTILEQYPDSSYAAMAHHYLAVGFAARQRYDLALTRWRRALALDERFVEAYEGAAQAALETGAVADALGFAERALALVEAGPRATALGERVAALRKLLELRKGEAEDNPDPKRLAAEGRVLLQIGQEERGLAKLQAAYDAGARDAGLLNLLAPHYERAGRVRQALELYDHLAKLDPTNDDLVRRRARLKRLLLVPKAFATRDRKAREKLLHEIALSGTSFGNVQAALRQCTEREPVARTGLVEGSFLVEEFLTPAAYTAYVPKAYDPRRAWPLIVAFHRESESGKEHFYNWEAVAAAERYILVFPSSPRPSGSWKFGDLTLVLSAVRHALATYHIDTDRVTIAGTGSGGLIAAATALRHPDLFAALVVRNAPIDEVTRLYLRSAVNLPVYLVASERASPEIIGSLREAQKALERWGYEVQTEEVPGYARNPALPELNAKILGWLDGKARNPYPSRVRLTTFEFSSAEAFWVRVEKFATTVFDPDRKLNVKAPFGQEYSPEQLRLIYLGEMAKTLGQVAATVVPGNRINVVTKHVEELTILLDDTMVDLDKPARIYVNGELAFRDKAPRSIEQLFESARYHRDPRLCYAASVTLKVK